MYNLFYIQFRILFHLSLPEYLANEADFVTFHQNLNHIQWLYFDYHMGTNFSIMVALSVAINLIFYSKNWLILKLGLVVLRKSYKI